ncbi:MAG: EamA family transporter, partial [Eubacterium sp.]|nr:EamA family transporter [Eubacterium sp.]
MTFSDNKGNNKANDQKSLLLFVSSMLIFGTIGVFRRYLPFSSALLAFSRGILGGVFLLIYVRLKKGRAKEKPEPRNLLWFVVVGCLIGINWMLLFEAYNYTTVSVATLCYYMQPTIVMLLSPLIFKEKLTGKKAVCATIAILGMVLVSGVIGDKGSQAGNMKGILLGLGAAVIYATVVIMNKINQGTDAYQKTTIQLLSAGLVMVPYLLLTERGGSYEFNASAIVLLL